VANWDILFVYDERATEHLSSQGLPHPPPRPGNRAPTLRELRSLGCPDVVFDVWVDDDDAVLVDLRMRARTYEAELRAAYAIAAICGQQWIYPASGAPSIVVDVRIDLERALRVWTEAQDRSDGVEWLHRELYGAPRET
jgi:hypothetical protein